MKAKKYELDGIIDTGAAVSLLVLGIVLVVLAVVMTIGPVIAGSIFKETESDINAITDTTVKASVNNSVYSGFEGLETFGGYIGLFVLGLIGIALITLMVRGFMGGQYGGTGVL